MGFGALIRNNVVQGNSSTGIITDRSMISGNTIHSKGSGISSDESTLLANTVYGNTGQGIGAGGSVEVANQTAPNVCQFGLTCP